METNKQTTDGRRRNNYLRVNQREGPVFPWKKLGYGRFSLCLLTLISEEKVKPGETYDRDFRGCGLTDEWLYNELVRFIPWLPDLYLGVRGSPLTPHVVYDRWHKGVVYQTEPGAGNSRVVGCSTEHPRNHPDLQPILSEADAAFKRNKPLSQAEVAAACTRVGFKFRKQT